MPRGHLGSYRESKSAIAKIVTKNECLLSLRLAGLSDSIHFDSILVTRQKPGFLRAERNRWLGLVTNKRIRGKTHGGIIIRFTRRRESDSVLACRRLSILIACPMPS